MIRARSIIRRLQLPLAVVLKSTVQLSQARNERRIAAVSAVFGSLLRRTATL